MSTLTFSTTRLRSQRFACQSADATGFTLLETVIAMLLMTIVGLGIASVFFYAASNTANAADREMAMAVAQQRIEQLRNVAFTDATLTATPTAGVTTTVTRAGRLHLIVTTIADSNVINGNATLKTITVKVIPLADTTLEAKNLITNPLSTWTRSVILVSERSSLTLGPNRSL